MTPLLLDINAPEFAILLILAVILFGPERLPDLARKAARVVRYVRHIAGNAQEQLRSELGPGFEDVDFRDLNPKQFVQKHLLDDVTPVVADVKSDLTGVRDGLREDRAEVVGAIEAAKDTSPGGPYDARAEARASAPFDTDAT